MADLLAPRRPWAGLLLGAAALVIVAGLGVTLAGRALRPGGADPAAEDGGSSGIQESQALPTDGGAGGPGSEAGASAGGEGASGADAAAGGSVEGGMSSAANTPAAAGPPPASAPSPMPTEGPEEDAGDEGPTPRPTPRIRPGNPVWSAAYMPRSPTIDGRLDDQRGPAVEFASVVFGAEHWEDGADLSARMMLGWNSHALFVSARVFDDVFSQPSSGDRLHLGDSLELQLDTDLYGDWDRSTYDIDDWQIGLSPGDFDTRGPEWWVWRPGRGSLNPEAGIEIAAERLADGYTIEAAIPWVLLEVRPAAGMAVGMSLNVSDNDSPEPAQLTMIASSPSRSWSDPRSFGTVVLEGGVGR